MLFDGVIFADLLDSRVISPINDEAPFRKWREVIRGLGERTDDIIAIVNTLTDIFDLPNATGYELDLIGSWVAQPRQGANDTRYRVYIQIRIIIWLSSERFGYNWTGTHNNILLIARTFIGPGIDPVILNPVPPYAFELFVPGIDLAEVNIFAEFICLARWAGVYSVLSISFLNGMICGSANVVIPTATPVCSVHVVIPNCGSASLAIKLSC